MVLQYLVPRLSPTKEIYYFNSIVEIGNPITLYIKYRPDSVSFTSRMIIPVILPVPILEKVVGLACASLAYMQSNLSIVREDFP